MVKWTAKHFDAIARILNRTKSDTPAWRLVVEEFMAEFELSNPLFNKNRFMKACGYEIE